MKWFDNLKIRTKLLSGFILVALISGVIGYIGIKNINDIAKADKNLYEKMAVPISELADISTNFQRVRVNARDLVDAKTPEEKKYFTNRIKELRGEIDKSAQSYEKTLFTEKGKALFKEFTDTDKAFDVQLDRVIELALAGKTAEAVALMGENGDSGKASRAEQNAIKKMMDFKVEVAKQTSDDNEKLANSASTFMITFIIIGMILAIGLGLLIARIIVGIMNNLQQQCTHLNQAVLEGRLDTRGDVEKINFEFRGIIKGINDIVDAFVAPINVTAEYVERIGKGDIPPKITDIYKGDFNEIKNNLNACIEAVNALVADANLLVEAAAEGRLNTRADAGKHGGEYRRIIQGFNNTLDAVIKPVNEAADCLKEMAKGNLDVAVTGDYRGDHNIVKEALNSTLSAINEILNQVTVAVDQVSAGSRQVSDSSQALSQGATEQASSLEEITSSAQEIAAQTRQNAENAVQANQLATQARTNAEKGNQQMGQMLKAMGEINESAANISKIIKAIDEIAFQTNLLALNAAVEAARAGKHGKGFTVVAEEVRNLAQRSAKAAKETAEMIEGSIKKTEVGTKIAEDTSRALEEIVAGATKVTDLIGEIASASKEQAEGIGQVNQGLGQVDQITQANTASAEESASASEELSSQALQLKQMLGRFRLRQQGMGAGMIASRNNFGQQGGSNMQGWGRASRVSSKAPADAAATAPWGVKPEDVISLDDSDFGKF